MNNTWLAELNADTCVLVPTRSLQTELHSQYAKIQIAAGRQVWRAANILTWRDYLQQLWVVNRRLFGDATTLIDGAQSRVVWERVIEQARRNENRLTLLNVRQTARAAERSWRLAHDWHIDITECQNSSSVDGQQFARWCIAYRQTLDQYGMLDVTLLLAQLNRLNDNGQITHKFCTVIWYQFDLITDAQQSWQKSASNQHIQHIQRAAPSVNQQINWHRYKNRQAEILEVLRQSRRLLEQDANQRIQIVVPDLQHSLAQVQALAARVFYAGRPPLELHNNDLVYRFSLGQPLAEWPATSVALRALQALRGTLKVSDLLWLWRSQFLKAARNLNAEIRVFERWLVSQRMDRVSIAALPQLIENAGFERTSALLQFARQLATKLEQIHQELDAAAEANGFKALGLTRWRELYLQWLDLWGWSTTVKDDSQNSFQYQLFEAWKALLQRFEGLALVLPSAGLSKSLSWLQQLMRDEVFLPKSAASPLVISGIYDAVGRDCDVLFVTAMDESFPAPLKADVFIGRQLQNVRNFPSSTAIQYVEQEQRVVNGLIASSRHCNVSYAECDSKNPEIQRAASPLYRQQAFRTINTPSASRPQLALETFTDSCGPPVDDHNTVRGGTRIFTDQSNCAFRAFARHRLQCSMDDEAEFGLDPLDRGVIVHKLLELAWQELGNKDQLDQLIDNQGLASFVQQVVGQTIDHFAPQLSDDKSHLLTLERSRLEGLLRDWLELEARRPLAFTAIKTEARGQHQVGGIQFRYIIDRIDRLEDGRTVVVDYKTGAVNRNDLLGERLKEPQMPLYLQAYQKSSRQTSAGVAFAQVQQHHSQFVELAESGIFQRQNRYAEQFADQWQKAKDDWPEQLQQLARHFLAGNAEVDPIDANTCRYCDLHALCRVNQMRPLIAPEAQNAE